jgi:hypothetical protein
MRTVAAFLMMIALVSCGAPGGVGKVTYAYDNTKSFRDGALAVAAIAGGLVSGGVSEAEQATARAVDANRSAEAINASNNAAKVASEEIGAGVIKATTLPK